MATTKPEQSLANHARFDPLFHFFAAPVFALTVIVAIVKAAVQPNFWNFWFILVSLAALAAVFLIRTYALKVQDRVIRLEERLRLLAIAPDALRSRIPDLSEPHLVALRFASDAEAPALAEKALNEKLSARQIKQAIGSWRPDYWRV